MFYLHENLEHANCLIDIIADDCPMNPRKDFDHAGTMVCFHSGYDLGDENGLDKLKNDLAESPRFKDAWADYYSDYQKDFDDPNDLIYMMDRCGFIWLPLYLYDHSGLTMNTSGFTCPWDSGCVGFIYATKATAISEFGKAICTAKVKERVVKCLEFEVEEYDQWLRGDVWGFVVKHNDTEEEESCWGFYGSEYCLTEAKDIAEHLNS